MHIFLQTVRFIIAWLVILDSARDKKYHVILYHASFF